MMGTILTVVVVVALWAGLVVLAVAHERDAKRYCREVARLRTDLKTFVLLGDQLARIHDYCGRDSEAVRRWKRERKVNLSAKEIPIQ